MYDAFRSGFSKCHVICLKPFIVVHALNQKIKGVVQRLKGKDLRGRELLAHRLRERTVVGTNVDNCFYAARGSDIVPE